MSIILSDHLKLRIKIRRISRLLPKKIIEQYEDLYFDKETSHWTAVKKEKYAGKIRPMVAVFDRINSDVKIITVYPSDEREISARITRGRWLYEKEKN